MISVEKWDFSRRRCCGPDDNAVDEKKKWENFLPLATATHDGNFAVSSCAIFKGIKIFIHMAFKFFTMPFMP
jgi:hypothetical protein